MTGASALANIIHTTGFATTTQPRYRLASGAHPMPYCSYRRAQIRHARADEDARPASDCPNIAQTLRLRSRLIMFGRK